LSYRFDGKQKTLALGSYPETSLKEAREKCDAARKLIGSNKDPGAVRKAEKREQKIAAINSFEAVAREFIAAQAKRCEPGYEKYSLRRLDHDIFPNLGKRPIAQIEAPELWEVLRKIEARGAHEMANRCRQLCGQVFRYGIATGRCARNPAADLAGALIKPKVKHIPSIDLKELPELLEKIERYDGEPVTRLALKFLALTFVRTGELIGAKWEEIDFANAVWTVPGPRMKMKNPHYVPLSSQALDIIDELKVLNNPERTPFVFAVNNPLKHMSENTMIYALYRLGYKSRHTGHGFRTLASTVLNEERERGRHNFGKDVIERQLDHCERDEIRDAYNRALYLLPRRTMMQWWADYLDQIRGGNVIQGRFGKTA
jgi:integrase